MPGKETDTLNSAKDHKVRCFNRDANHQSNRKQVRLHYKNHKNENFARTVRWVV